MDLLSQVTTPIVEVLMRPSTRISPPSVTSNSCARRKSSSNIRSSYVAARYGTAISSVGPSPIFGQGWSCRRYYRLAGRRRYPVTSSMKGDVKRHFLPSTRSRRGSRDIKPLALVGGLSSYSDPTSRLCALCVQRSQLPSCPFRNEGSMRALRGATRAWPESSDIELKFKADAREGVTMQTQGWRCLADIALVVSKRGRDESFLELA